MKAKRNLIQICLLCAAMLSAAVQAQFYYVTNNGTITITGNTGVVGAVSIPSTINDLPVTSIGEYAFEYLSSVTSVTIPNSITNIGDWAFWDSSLTSVTIPDSVTSIGNYVFFLCSSLTNVTLGNSVTSIGIEAFASCNSLTNIAFPNTLINIGNWAFSSCPLTNITIPNSVTTIGDWTFYNCIGLTSVTLPNSVTTIGDSTFYNCINLARVALPNNIISIGNSVFSLCTSLTNVTIPKSVTSIGDGAFDYCTCLTNISVAADNPAYTSVSGVLFDKQQTTLIQFPAGLAGSYMIPNSVTNIGNYAFGGCTWLTGITIPNSVTSIGNFAFNGCGPTNITIPNSVTSIGDDAFFSCTSLTNVTIGNSVTIIGKSAFWNCIKLTSMIIPNSVISIGTNAFYYCTSLTAAYFQGNAPPDNGTAFAGDSSARVYHLPGTMGWGARFGSRPTALWTLPYPVILSGANGNTNLGVQNNQFGFKVSWATNLSVIVLAATNMANPVWTPVATNALTNGTFYFSDFQWTNYPGRFYRLRSP